jgi:GH18 family chitinase
MLSCESWKEFWNENQLVPYAKGKDNFPWAGYDNVKSMKIKADYIIKEKLAGAMFWVCYSEKYKIYSKELHELETYSKKKTKICCEC